jgi:hypothetical protein
MKVQDFLNIAIAVLGTAVASAQKYCNAANVDLVLYNPSSAPDWYDIALPYGACQSFPEGTYKSQIYNTLVVVPTTQSPSVFPTSRPTYQPSSQPSTMPTGQKFLRPTGQPSAQPSSHPSRLNPSGQPSDQPTEQPSKQPVGAPTAQPTDLPTSHPSRHVPTSHPTEQPTGAPSDTPLTWVNVGDLYVGIDDSEPQVSFVSTSPYSYYWEGLVCQTSNTGSCGGENSYNIYLNTTENLPVCPPVVECPEDNKDKNKLSHSASEAIGITVAVLGVVALSCCLCKGKGRADDSLLGNRHRIFSDGDKNTKQSPWANAASRCLGC